MCYTNNKLTHKVRIAMHSTNYHIQPTPINELNIGVWCECGYCLHRVNGVHYFLFHWAMHTHVRLNNFLI